MISMMDSTPSGTRDWVPSFCLRVGQYSAKVLAIRNLYLLPAFEALAATPPGKVVITPGAASAAWAARSAASMAASWVRARNQRFPPMIPSAYPNRRERKNSPPRVGIVHPLWSNISLRNWCPSPKKAILRPSL